MGAPRLLPFERRDRIDPIAFLEERSRRLANIVEAMSRRKDVRDFRARLLILLLEMRCPLNVQPVKRWYVPGAVARVGAEGLRRAWLGYYGEEPRSIRTFRSHITALEKHLAIMRSPGDWLPVYANDPKKRPRFASTIHILESDRVAVWWEEVGAQRMAEKPKCRTNPDKWAAHFGDWRDESAKERRDLFSMTSALAALDKHEHPTPDEEETPVRCEADRASKVLVDLLRKKVDSLDLMKGLKKAGCPLRGRNTWKLVSDRRRFEGAAALLACALARGDRIRNRAGWLVRAWTRAPISELIGALALVRQRAMPIQKGPHISEDPYKVE